MVRSVTTSPVNQYVSRSGSSSRRRASRTRVDPSMASSWHDVLMDCDSTPVRRKIS